MQLRFWRVFFGTLVFVQFSRLCSLTLDLCLCSGGLRLKRDVAEFTEFVRSFKAPAVDEKFELLGT
jgi:hypothetical protein